MFRKLTTTPVNSTVDIKAFFDQCAHAYSEQHGHPERLLNYRIRLIKQHAQLCTDDVVLDIGCGNGHHLLALAGEIGRGIGIDLSSGMIEVAQKRLQNSPWQETLTFLVDNGEELFTIAQHSIDVAICIGAFEHMPNKPSVLASIYRVLNAQRRFICLTLNGGYLWYRVIAPLLGLESKHLSTDKFLTRNELVHLLTDSGFRRIQVRYWTFIPEGDIPFIIGFVLQGLDRIGKLFRVNSLRGGLLVCAWKER